MNKYSEISALSLIAHLAVIAQYKMTSIWIKCSSAVGTK